MRRSLIVVGIVLALVGMIGTLLLGIAASWTTAPAVSLNLLGRLIVPGIFFLGLMLLVAGLLWSLVHFRRAHRGDSARSSLVLVGLSATLLILGVTAVTGPRAYEYTESTEFCGQACHSVMEPEATTHQISPHAQVACASCHVGHTLPQYIEAKLFGLHELRQFVTDSHPRPIPTPIQVMEPVRENCTGCHWQGMYWGKKYRDYSHYITEENNQLWTVKMNVKVGGEYRLGGDGEGIHWHMKLGPRVSYIARDEKLTDIPFVRLVRESGEESIYRSTEDPLDASEIAQLEEREMGCIDCHNRPAHQFKAPILAIDDAMRRGRIDPSLPDVKEWGVELLASTDYANSDEAVETIRGELIRRYGEEHPDLLETRPSDIEDAAQTLGILYRQNFFPEMKADWRAYPDHIGHFLSDGCFRCHDGEHVDDQGRAISNDCSLCHDIVSQGPPEEIESNQSGLPFRHPVDFGAPPEELGKCTVCHDGALG